MEHCNHKKSITKTIHFGDHWVGNDCIHYQDVLFWHFRPQQSVIQQVTALPGEWACCYSLPEAMASWQHAHAKKVKLLVWTFTCAAWANWAWSVCCSPAADVTPVIYPHLPFLSLAHINLFHQSTSISLMLVIPFNIISHTTHIQHS